jgi:hypothetical protein
MVKSEANLGELFAAIAKICEIEGSSKQELGKTTSAILREAAVAFQYLRTTNAVDLKSSQMD